MYDGWYRCGYFETELVIRDNFNVEGEVRVLSSIHLPENPGDADPLFGPLDQGDAEAWLERQDEGTILPSGLRGSLVGIDDVEDWLGSFQLLMLQPYLQARLGLSPRSDQQSKLELVDEVGHVAVVFRHWAERPVGDRISEEAPRLKGGDLLVRPDVFARMELIAGRPPVTVTLNARDVEESDDKDALAADISIGQQV